MKLIASKSCVGVLLSVLALSFTSSIAVVDAVNVLQGENDHQQQDGECKAMNIGTTGLKRPAFITVEENVITIGECNAILNNIEEEKFKETRNGYRYFTQVELEDNVMHKFNDCYGNSCSDSDGGLSIISDDVTAARNVVPISRVTTTTKIHQDRHYAGNNDEDVGSIVDESIVILYLTDNPGASFVYNAHQPNDEKRVPVKCGTKLTFHGGYPHHTVMNDFGVVGGGIDSRSSASAAATTTAVKFLGPVTAMSNRVVGDFYAGPCENLSAAVGSECSCQSCDLALPTPIPFAGCCQSSQPIPEECIDPVQYINDPSLCPSPSPSPSSNPSTSPSTSRPSTSPSTIPSTSPTTSKKQKKSTKKTSSKKKSGGKGDNIMNP